MKTVMKLNITSYQPRQNLKEYDIYMYADRTQKKLKELLGEPREPYEVLAPLKTRGSSNTGKYSTIGSRNSSSWSH